MWKKRVWKGFIFFVFVLLSLNWTTNVFALTKRVAKVEVYQVPDKVSLMIYLSHPTEPEITWLPGERERMVLSFKGFDYRATLRKLSIRRGDIWEVRGGQYTKEEARVVVEFTSSRIPYTLSKREGGKLLVYQFYSSSIKEEAKAVKEVGYIEDVKVEVLKEGIRVKVRGGAPLNPRISWVKKDKGLDVMLLDFEGFTLKEGEVTQDVNAFGVSNFSVKQLTPRVVRLSLTMEADKLNYKLESSSSGRDVFLYLFPKPSERIAPRAEKEVRPSFHENWASKKVTLDFRGADIRDVLRALAKAVDVNIIIDQEVQGIITVTFTDVPFAQAFDWVLRLSGLSYRNLGYTLVVGKEERLRELFDRKDTKVFLLSNAMASDIIKLVSAMTGVENIAVDPRMNALVVKGSLAEIKKVEDVIKLLDREAPQVMVEAKLVGVSLESGKSLGFVLSNISKGKFYNINIDPTSQITISYSSDESASAAFDATINAWVSSGRARVLASPSVATLSGLKAVINLTRDYKYYSRVEEIQDNERTITQKWETITYGPQLVITPYVGEGDKITLDIDIDVSIVTRWIEYAGQRIPEIGHRKVTTKLRVKDGQPIVIGGLITEEDIKNLFKVPLLGDLPFIGTIFRSETSSRTREEVVLIVTPKILKN